MSFAASVAAVRLDLHVEPHPSRYDRLEVGRGYLGPYGPFESLTADTWMPARIPADAARPSAPVAGRRVPLGGRQLVLALPGGVELTIPFSATHTLGEVAAILAAEPLLDSWVTGDGRLAVETYDHGARAILEIVRGDAAPLLGLSSEVAFGKDPHLVLVPGKTRYAFVDPNGLRSAFYRTRMRSSITGEVGAWSAPIPAQGPERLPADAMARGVLRLLDPAGRPLRRRRVLVLARMQSLRGDDTVIVTGTHSRKTDDRGYVEFLLPRGLDVVVAVDGTNLVRDVRVPSDPTVESFPLLGDEDEAFRVQVPTLSGAPRSHL